MTLNYISRDCMVQPNVYGAVPPFFEGSVSGEELLIANISASATSVFFLARAMLAGLLTMRLKQIVLIKLYPV